jgi:protein-tyrosine kinase
MAKTFEALLKAEEESQKKKEKIIAFEPKPGIRRPWENGRSSKLKISPQSLEQYRQIKHNILRNASGKTIQTLLFLSPTEGEGNSTILINFAITLTIEGEKVLLVDANLKKPSFHHLFDLEKENGFAELALEKVTLKDIIKGTDFNNLFVVTSGTVPSNPTSVFESKSLGLHIEEMKTQADWVIFDAPHINSYDDSINLAAKVDGVVMVVEAEKTHWEVAEHAKQRVENSNGKILGVILNKRQYHIPGWLYKTL